MPDSLLKLLPEEVVAVLPFESNIEDEEPDVEEKKCVKKGCELPEPDNSNTLYLVIKQDHSHRTQCLVEKSIL